MKGRRVKQNRMNAESHADRAHDGAMKLRDRATTAFEQSTMCPPQGEGKVNSVAEKNISAPNTPPMRLQAMA